MSIYNHLTHLFFQLTFKDELTIPILIHSISLIIKCERLKAVHEERIILIKIKYKTII